MHQELGNNVLGLQSLNVTTIYNSLIVALLTKKSTFFHVIHLLQAHSKSTTIETKCLFVCASLSSISTPFAFSFSPSLVFFSPMCPHHHLLLPWPLAPLYTNTFILDDYHRHFGPYIFDLSFSIDTISIIYATFGYLFFHITTLSTLLIWI